MSFPNFVLASASPARRRLLQSVGINPTIHISYFDEDQIQIREPESLVKTLASEKAKIVAAQRQNSLILGCDSVLLVEGEIYGKPESDQAAIARWQAMSGHYGLLYTGHTLIDQTQNRQVLRCGITKVHFAKLDTATIHAYVASGEPRQCAGAFAIEGKGGLFVEKIEGCHSNVIGLSLPLFHQMLTELGYHVSNFWVVN